MGKIIIVANRLPFRFSIDNNKLSVSPSEGGLATGMRSIHTDVDSMWIGWTGLAKEEISHQFVDDIEYELEKTNCASVLLTQKDIDLFYYGFSNNIIWPLFHYFGEYGVIKQEYWDAYVEVNKKYADVILANASVGDKIWIHDYHFLLLPQMIKERMPDVSIGFFLHIPFPSFEIFRTLPWRDQLLNGMLGADLVGFHTFDYKRHFLSAVKRLLGNETKFNQIFLNNRIVAVEEFPMGIDFDRFHNASMEHFNSSLSEKSIFEQEIYKYLLLTPQLKLVLSIDRLDYTKGIARRLRAFDDFLAKYPEYIGRVTLLMLTVPSRSDIEQYQLMKSEIDELVGSINAKYSTINWRPVWYFYRSVPFDNLVSLYNACDIALVTPVRDGMNLVAKEYIASRFDKKGVLILSEMAGASKEMSEAIIVNPYNSDEISIALKQALEMPEGEQVKRNEILQTRLRKYNVEKWAKDFMSSLNRVCGGNETKLSVKLINSARKSVLSSFKDSKNRVIFLDYDGTLVDFKKNPNLAYPDKELYDLLDNIANNLRNNLVIISGRKRNDLDEWFVNKSYTLVAEHGVWIKKDNIWRCREDSKSDWSDLVYPIMDFYVDRTPGSHIEEKDYAMVWHYRNVDPELGTQRANELRDELSALSLDNNLEILEGNKIVEVKSANINKGKVANSLLMDNDYDNVTCIGDDLTDEYMFRDLPSSACSIKVGHSDTAAKYILNNYKDVREFLLELSML